MGRYSCNIFIFKSTRQKYWYQTIRPFIQGKCEVKMGSMLILWTFNILPYTGEGKVKRYGIFLRPSMRSGIFLSNSVIINPENNTKLMELI